MVIISIFLAFLIILGFQNCKGVSNLLGLTIDEIEQKVFELVNEYRVAQGKPALILDGSITLECRTHSENMAQSIVQFSHEGFEGRVTSISRRINVIGAGENIGYNHNYLNPAKAAFSTWRDNEEHRHNIEGDFDLTGVGVAKNSDDVYYFTQIFIKSR